MNKYYPLYEYLVRCKKDSVISFDEINKIIGDELPRSAYIYPAWWSNAQDGSHPHCRNWVEAGLCTQDAAVNIAVEKMLFVKT